MQTKPRSEFVSVVAWVFIVVAAIAVAYGTNAYVLSLVAYDFEADSQSVSEQNTVLSFLHWDWEATPNRVQYSHGVWTAVFAMVLIASVGLERRQPWARRFFVFWMVFGALLAAMDTINGIWFLFKINWVASLGGEIALRTLQILGIAIKGGLVVVFIWIARRLWHTDADAEFQ